MLADGFLILAVERGVFVLDDFAQADLGQFLGHKFLVEQPALHGRLVLHEGGDDLVEVFLTDARRLFALRRGQPLNFDLEPSACLVEANVAPGRIVAAFAIVEPLDRTARLIFRLEIKARGQHLLHEKAGRNRLQRVVDRFRDSLFGRIGFGDKIGEARAVLARRVPCRAADDLHDLGQARPVTNRQRMLAPDPVEPFLGHAERDDDVHMVAVVLLACVLQRGGNPVAPGGVIINQIGDPEDPALLRLDQLEPRHRVGALPLAQFLNNVFDLPCPSYFRGN